MDRSRSDARVYVSYLYQFLWWGVVSTSPNPQPGGPPLVGCLRLLILYARSYPPYWSPFLHPKPEDAPCRGDRDPLIMEGKHLSHMFPINPLNPELNPICYLLALSAHHFLHVSRIMVKSLPVTLLMSYVYIYIYIYIYICIYIWSACSWCF